MTGAKFTSSYSVSYNCSHLVTSALVYQLLIYPQLIFSVFYTFLQIGAICQQQCSIIAAWSNKHSLTNTSESLLLMNSVENENMNSYYMFTYLLPTYTKLLLYRISMFHSLFTQLQACQIYWENTGKKAILLYIQLTDDKQYFRNHKHVTQEAKRLLLGYGRQCNCTNPYKYTRGREIKIFGWITGSLNGSKGNIQPFVSLPNIWSFVDSPENVNQNLCTWGINGEGNEGKWASKETEQNALMCLDLTVKLYNNIQGVFFFFSIS